MAREVAEGPGTQTCGLDFPLCDEVAVFDALIISASGRLSRTAYLLTGNWHEAEDLVQEALVLGWRHRDRLLAADSPTAYLHRILVSRSVSRWRSVRRRLASERLTDQPPESASLGAGHRDDELWQAVLALPSRQRAVMVLTYYEDLADADIARVLECTVGTVKSQRAKSLRTLRSRLGDRDETEEDR